MSQVYTSIIRPVIFNTFFFARILWFVCISKSALPWEIFYDPKQCFDPIFIYLIFVYLIDFILSKKKKKKNKKKIKNKQVLEYSRTHLAQFLARSINVLCSRCWLAQCFKTLSDKLMLIGQTFSERKTRLIGNSFCHFIC